MYSIREYFHFKLHSLWISSYKDGHTDSQLMMLNHYKMYLPSTACKYGRNDSENLIITVFQILSLVSLEICQLPNIYFPKIQCKRIYMQTSSFMNTRWPTGLDENKSKNPNLKVL